jgi:hypothetical protein
MDILGASDSLNRQRPPLLLLPTDPADLGRLVLLGMGRLRGARVFRQE